MSSHNYPPPGFGFKSRRSGQPTPSTSSESNQVKTWLFEPSKKVTLGLNWFYWCSKLRVVNSEEMIRELIVIEKILAVL